MNKKVLIVASGLSSRQIHNYDYKANGWTIFTINNAWQLIDYWDYTIHPDDLEGKWPRAINESQKIIREAMFKPLITQKYGPPKDRGSNITLCGAYFALSELQPSIIGFLGADMNYTPDAQGNTSFYGVGYDIKKRNMPDPDYMVKRLGKGDKNYLTRIFQKFEQFSAESNCKVFNFSDDPDTRLPFKQTSPKKIDE